MTYDAFEEGQDTSRPVEFAVITIGAETFRYTSAEDDVVVSSVTYTALALDIGDHFVGPENRSNLVELILPASNAFVKKYRQSVPGSRAFVEVFRYQRDDGGTPEVRSTFKGVVDAVTFNKNATEAAVTVIPLIGALSRSLPRCMYHGACNHELYNVDTCMADKTDSAFRLSAAISSISDSTVTIPGAAAFGDGFFNGGYIELSGITDSRLVLTQTGDVFTVLLPFFTDPTGVTAIAQAGCDRLIPTCKGTFDNVINFGGFAFVPTKNIFKSGLTT